MAHLLGEEIIEPSVSPWQAQLLVISGENHKKYLVVDCGDAINLYTELDAYPMPNITDMINNMTLDLKSAYHQLPIQDGDKKYTAFEVDGKLYQFSSEIER